MKNATSNSITWLLLLLGPITAIFMTPQFSYDPINIPKFSILITSGIIILFLLLTDMQSAIQGLPKVFVIASLLLIIQMTLVLFFSGSPFSQQLYGVIGRHTGYLAYFALVIISLGAGVVANNINAVKFVFGLILSGVITGIYGVIQTLGLDPVNWNNPYNSILGFLGNPNFASSFLAISAIATLAFGIKPKIQLTMRVLASSVIAMNLILIVRSQSRQGLLVFAAGSAVVFFFYVIQNRSKFGKIAVFSYSILSSIGVSLLVLGSLKIGPLSDLLYKLSVRQRGYYWHAAFEMIKERPIFGVGLDSYGNWYFAERSANAAFNTPTVSSNAAHNVFLDLGANGGVILMTIYISMVGFTMFSIIGHIKRSKEFNWAFTAMVGAWIGYIAQSLISINQLGLATYGWLFMGCIIGIVHKDKKQIGDLALNASTRVGRISKKKSNDKATKSRNLSIFLGLMTSVVFVFPLYSGDINYRATAKAGKVEEHIKSATTFPIFSSRITETANYLANIGRLDDAEILVDKAIRENKRDYNAWFLKFQLSKTGSVQEKNIEKILNSLNPKVKISK